MFRTNEDVINSMISQLFRSAQTTEEEFHRRAKQTIRKTFDAYVQPFVMPEEGKRLKIGLRGIMSVPIGQQATIAPMSFGTHAKFCLLSCTSL
jgi:hypothetical protein